MQRELTFEMSKFEKFLETSLHPVKPNQDFIDRLEDRLINPGNISIETRKKMSLLIVVSILSFSLMLFYWLIRKLIKVIFG